MSSGRIFFKTKQIIDQMYFQPMLVIYVITFMIFFARFFIDGFEFQIQIAIHH